MEGKDTYKYAFCKPHNEAGEVRTRMLGCSHNIHNATKQLQKQQYMHRRLSNSARTPSPSPPRQVNIVTDPENLGEWLTGDDIQNSPYLLQMKTDSYCMQLCTQYLGRSKKGGIPTLIKNEYHHNWIVDNIPSAMRMENR